YVTIVAAVCLGTQWNYILQIISPLIKQDHQIWISLGPNYVFFITVMFGVLHKQHPRFTFIHVNVKVHQAPHSSLKFLHHLGQMRLRNLSRNQLDLINLVIFELQETSILCIYVIEINLAISFSESW
ncbi:hypothetical protein ACJX0J_028190, partial [Zea mays]